MQHVRRFDCGEHGGSAGAREIALMPAHAASIAARRFARYGVNLVAARQQRVDAMMTYETGSTRKNDFVHSPPPASRPKVRPVLVGVGYHRYRHGPLDTERR